MTVIPVIRKYQIPGAYPLNVISDESSELLYVLLQEFWVRRHENMNAEDIEHVLNEYRTNVKSERRTLPAAKAAERALALAGGAGRDRAGRILETGGANGALIYALRETGQETGIHVTNFEPWEPFVDDFKKHLPEHDVIHAGAEEFIDISKKPPFSEKRFDVFYESSALCMTPPRIARAVLARAKDLCREIVICDCIINGATQLNTDENLMVEYDIDCQQYYFAHNYDAYLTDIGYGRVTTQFLPWPDGKTGWGLIHAAPKTA